MSILNKIIMVFACFFAILALFLHFRVNILAEQNNTLKSQKNELNDKIKGYENEISKYNEAQARASEKIEKIRTIVRTVKSDCDCYNIALPDDVRRMLHDK